MYLIKISYENHRFAYDVWNALDAITINNILFSKCCFLQSNLYIKQKRRNKTIGLENQPDMKIVWFSCPKNVMFLTKIWEAQWSSFIPWKVQTNKVVSTLYCLYSGENWKIFAQMRICVIWTHSCQEINSGGKLSRTKCKRATEM